MGPPRYPSGLATEEAEASHRLHQLANVTGVTSRRIDGETAELCAQPPLANDGAGLALLISAHVIDDHNASESW